MIKNISSSLHHILIEPEAPTGDRHPTVIMLHGLGADEHDLAGLAQYLDSRLLTVSVRAPFALEWGGYKWYDFYESGKPDPDQFHESCDHLTRFIDDAVNHYPIDAKQVYLLGFSMGAVMSLAMALSMPRRFRGVLANSGYLAEETHLAYRWDELHSTHFFVAHGMYDPVVPVAASRVIKEKLDVHKASLEYHEYPVVHTICEEGVNAMARWLTQHIDARND